VLSCTCQRDSTGTSSLLRSASLRSTSIIARGHENQLEATHRTTFGILCSLSDQRLTNIYLEGFLDLTTVVSRAPKINSVWIITLQTPPVRISAQRRAL
jgi:hypothetical protein